MFYNRIAVVLALGWIAWPASRASGEILVDHSPPLSNYAVTSDPIQGLITADDFTLASPASATSITFWGGYNPSGVPVPDHFTLAFYSDASGLPGMQTATRSIIANRVDTGQVILFAHGVSLYKYEATFSAVSLSSGQQWLSIYNTTSSTESSWIWSQYSGANGNGTAAYILPSSGNRVGIYADLAFQLVGTSVVPEPSSLALVAIASVAGLAVSRARRKRA